MKKSIALVTGAGILIAGAFATAPAHADTSSYLERVQRSLPYVMSQYGSTEVIRMGNQICAWEAQGTDASGMADLITAQMPMSRYSAFTLKAIADSKLGC